jgi:hypothetical protein
MARWWGVSTSWVERSTVPVDRSAPSVQPAPLTAVSPKARVITHIRGCEAAHCIGVFGD